jgi:hypothetical protein
MTKKKYSSEAQAARDEVATDYNLFYSLFDITRGMAPMKDRIILMGEKKAAYAQMDEIARKHSHDSALKNKLDEAERAVWPNGRR